MIVDLQLTEHTKRTTTHKKEAKEALNTHTNTQTDSRSAFTFWNTPNYHVSTTFSFVATRRLGRCLNFLQRNRHRHTHESQELSCCEPNQMRYVTET